MAARRGSIVLVLLAAIPAALLALLLFERDGEVDRVAPSGARLVASAPGVEGVPAAARGSVPAVVSGPPAATSATPAAVDPITGSVRIRVVDSGDGSRVPGASLTFSAGSAYRSGTSDAAGEALFPDLPGPRGDVLVAAPGRADARVEFSVERGAESLVIVRFRRLRLLHGVVRSAFDGRPIPGATVVVQAHDPLSSRREGGPLQTDRDGRFTMPEPADGEGIPIYARAEGFAHLATEFGDGVPATAASPSPVDLDPAGRIRGVVRDDAGAALAGIELTAFPVDSPSPDVEWRRPRSGAFDQTRSDAAGAFTLDGLARGGLYRVRAQQNGRDRPCADVEVFLPLDALEVARDLVVARAGGLRVHWTPEDVELAVGSVAVLSADRRVQLAQELLGVGSTEYQAGTVEFTELPPGPVIVRLFVSGLRGEASARVAAGETGEVVVALGKGGWIEGVVRLADGEPRVDAQVIAVSPSPEPARAYGSFVVLSADDVVAVVVTDVEGRFRLEGLQEGESYEIQCERTKTNIRASRSDVVLTVPATGSLQGRAVLPPDAEIPGIMTIRVEAEGGSVVSVPFLGDGGTFLVELVPSGRARVSILAGEFLLQPRDVEIPKGGCADLGDLHLSSGAVLRGTVKDSEGQPMRGLCVSMEMQSAWEFSATTARDGRFSLGQVPAGRYTVRVADDSLGTATEHVVEVGEDGADVVLVHERGWALRGTARDRAGVPLVGTRARVLSEEGGEARVVIPVDYRGRWSTRVAAGGYRVELVSAAGATVAEGRATVTEGGETVLDLVGER